MFAARGRPVRPSLAARVLGRALDFRTLSRAFSVAAVLALLSPAAAHAQWVMFTFNPWGGTYAAGEQLSVTIEMCGQDGAWFDAPGGVYFNGQWANFGSYTDTHPDCSDYQVHSGTIIRLAAQFDARNLATGLHNHTVVVRHWSGATMEVSQAAR